MVAWNLNGATRALLNGFDGVATGTNDRTDFRTLHPNNFLRASGWHDGTAVDVHGIGVHQHRRDRILGVLQIGFAVPTDGNGTVQWVVLICHFGYLYVDAVFGLNHFDGGTSTTDDGAHAVVGDFDLQRHVAKLTLCPRSFAEIARKGGSFFLNDLSGQSNLFGGAF